MRKFLLAALAAALLAVPQDAEAQWTCSWCSTSFQTDFQTAVGTSSIDLEALYRQFFPDGLRSAPTLPSNWNLPVVRPGPIVCSSLSLRACNGPVADVPEPGGVALLLTGLLGLAFVGWRRRELLV